ncbi:hypothetical protein PoB_003481000 [Plakobranchus ocellatus]|uniref:Uncharacterized protein n=1 Tax=Plakobranchus ocellatus TaxID=259542 RepID=A0AAV4AJF5_9GAST|nr:hypothetical protein PoB_003481000 [Plakobranchus ocellatus]
MFTVKFFTAILGIGVLCTAQSNVPDLSQMFQGLANNNPELAQCYEPLLGCAQTLQTEVQSGYDNMCSSLRKYISCTAKACNLNSDVEDAMLQLLAASLRSSNIYCDFGSAQNGQDRNDRDGTVQDGNGQDGNGQDRNDQDRNGQDGNVQDGYGQDRYGPNGYDQDRNGQPSVKKSSIDFILMGLMITFGLFIFRV